MRIATAGLVAKLNTLEGTAPLLVVKITWPLTGVVYYSEIPLTFGIIDCFAAIKTFSTLQGEVTIDNVGAYSGASVTLLDDNSQTLKGIFDANQAEGAAVEVYHWYSALPDTDAMLLLRGVVKSDIDYSDGARTLSFNIENTKEGALVGYALEDEVDIISRDVSPEMVDQPWPLIFGTVLKSKALRLERTLETTLAVTFNQDSSVYKFTDGYKFPQDTPITVEIAGIGFTGTMAGNAFTVTEKVVPIFTDLDIDARVVGPYQYSPFVFWLDDVEDIKNKFVYITDGTDTMVNFCTDQDGAECWFRHPWTLDRNFVLVDNTWTVTEVAKLPRPSWLSVWNYTINPLYDIPNLVSLYDIGRSLGGVIEYQSVFAIKWKIEAGARVVLKPADTDEVYIANLIESDSLLEVFAYRTLNGERIFVPVPSSYFTYDVADTALLAGASNPPVSGTTVTTITFAKPLSIHYGENWEEDIYVSLKSTVDDNAADIIEWIIDTYLSYGVDATSFSIAHDQVQYCPMGFTLNELKDAWALCTELAWQARCAIWSSNDDVFLKYLSEVPSAYAKIFSNTDIELKTVALSCIPAEDVVTYIEATYKKEYRPLEPYEEEQLLTYKTTDEKFKENEKQWDFYAYNIEDMVRLSLNFWGYRAVKQWRKVDFNSFLINLRLEVFDFTQFSTYILGQNTIPGYLLKSHFESDDSRMTFEMLLASYVGLIDLDSYPAYDVNFWTGNQVYPLVAPVWVGEGRSLIDYDPEKDARDQKVFLNNDDTEKKEPGDKFFLKFSKWPDLMLRGTNYTLKIQVEDEYGNVCNVSGVCKITPTSSFDDDLFWPVGLDEVDLQSGFIVIDDFVVNTIPPGSDEEANGSISVEFIEDADQPDWIESISSDSVSGIKIVGPFPVEFVDT